MKAKQGGNKPGIKSLWLYLNANFSMLACSPYSSSFTSSLLVADIRMELNVAASTFSLIYTAVEWINKVGRIIISIILRRRTDHLNCEAFVCLLFLSLRLQQQQKQCFSFFPCCLALNFLCYFRIDLHMREKHLCRCKCHNIHSFCFCFLSCSTFVLKIQIFD